MNSVAYVTTTFPTLASFLEDEVHRLVARGVRVRVFTLRGPGRLHQPRHAALLPLVRRVGAPLDPRAGWALLAWLVRRPRVLVPEALRILWASRRSPYALAGHLAWIPAACRVASLVEREGLERVHGAWAHFPGTVAYLAARLAGRPFSLAGHAGADLHRTRAFLAEKARAAEFVTACVRGNAEMLAALAGPGARVEWIAHGVDLGRFDGAGRAPAARPLLLVVGTLMRPKGFDDAVRAVAILAGRGIDAELAVVGGGPERGRLERLAAERGVADRVRFTGPLGHAELLPLYRRAWLLLAPSREMPNGRRDGLPNVVVEAMAMGVPCVGARAGGIGEAIEPGVTGALVPSDDPAALAEAAARLLADPEGLARMGREARRRALERFDAARSFERLYALFQGGAGAAQATGAA